jgi:hypothetical protein
MVRILDTEYVHVPCALRARCHPVGLQNPGSKGGRLAHWPGRACPLPGLWYTLQVELGRCENTQDSPLLLVLFAANSLVPGVPLSRPFVCVLGAYCVLRATCAWQTMRTPLPPPSFLPQCCLYLATSCFGPEMAPLHSGSGGGVFGSICIFNFESASSNSISNPTDGHLLKTNTRSWTHLW